MALPQASLAIISHCSPCIQVESLLWKVCGLIQTQMLSVLGVVETRAFVVQMMMKVHLTIIPVYPRVEFFLGGDPCAIFSVQ